MYQTDGSHKYNYQRKRGKYWSQSGNRNNGNGEEEEVTPGSVGCNNSYNRGNNRYKTDRNSDFYNNRPRSGYRNTETWPLNNAKGYSNDNGFNNYTRREGNNQPGYIRGRGQSSRSFDTSSPYRQKSYGNQTAKSWHTKQNYPKSAQNYVKSYQNVKSSQNDATRSQNDSMRAKNDVKSYRNDATSAQNDAKNSQNDVKSCQNSATNSQNDSNSSQNDVKSCQNDAKHSKNEGKSSVTDATSPQSDCKKSDNDTKSPHNDGNVCFMINHITVSQNEVNSPNINTSSSKLNSNLSKKNQNFKKHPPKKKSIRSEQKHKNQPPPVNPIVVDLDTELSFDDQVKEIVDQVKMTDEEVENTSKILEDVKTAFETAVPGVEPLLFGSVLAGTAFRNSDVDVFLKCETPLDDKFLHDFGYLPSKNNLFKRVIKIQARVPIIRGINARTGNQVDISFTSPFGVYNSRLVKHICSHNPMINRFLILVLMWAKHHQLIGSTLSSFCIIMLAIFYLQTVNIVPPFWKLIDKVEGSDWPSGFNKDESLLIKNNGKAMESLLLGFFSFYSEVRFEEVVISPYSGMLVPVCFFEDNFEMLPSVFDDYKRMVKEGASPRLFVSQMTVQEPFDLSLNCGRNATLFKVESFNKACYNSSEVFRKVHASESLLILFTGLCSEKGSEFRWNMACPPGIEGRDWLLTVTNAVRIVLTELLLMTVDNYDRLTDNKLVSFRLKNPQSQAHLTRLIASSSQNIFQTPRSKFQSLVKSTKGSEFQQESKASRLILEDNKKKQKINFKSQIACLTHKENKSVDVNFINLDLKTSSSFDLVIHYLKGGHFKRFMSLAFKELTLRCSQNIPS